MKYKRIKLDIDEKCTKCLNDAIRNLKNDIKIIDGIRNINFQDIDNIIDDSSIDSLINILNLKSMYLKLTSVPLSYEYNKILQNMFPETNIYPKEILLVTENKGEQYYRLLNKIRSDLKKFYKQYEPNEVNEIENIINTNFGKNGNYIIELISNNVYYDYGYSDDIIIQEFIDILYITNYLWIELNNKPINDNYNCDINYDMDDSSNELRDILDYTKEQIEEYCIHDKEYKKPYYEIVIKDNNAFTIFIDTYFKRDNPSQYYDDLLNKIKYLNNNQKINIFRYLGTQLYLFFNKYMEKIAYENKLKYESYERIHNRYYENLKNMLISEEYKNIDIDETNELIIKLKNKHPNLQELEDIIIANYEKDKNIYLNMNNIHSTNILFIINYYVISNHDNESELLHIIEDGNFIIDMLDQESVIITNNRKEYLNDFFTSYLWDYYYDTYLNYYDPNYWKSVNNEDMHNFTDLIDYFIVLQFAKINNIRLQDNLVRNYLGIIEKYTLDNNTNNVSEIEYDSCSNSIFTINNTYHSTSLIKLDNQYIYFDSIYDSYPYMNDYFSSIFKNNFKILSAELSTTKYNIQHSENISNLLCFDNKYPLLNEKGFCVSWAYYFKLVYLLNIDRINKYEDLVNLIRYITFGNNILDDYTKIRNQYKLVKSMLIELYILYNNNVISWDIIALMKKDNIDGSMFQTIMENIFNQIELNSSWIKRM